MYHTRPAGCRDFNCLWLRGAIVSDPELRPDRLGVMFDWYQSLSTNRERCVAFELWNGAFEEPRAADLLRAIAMEREVELSYRDGMWRTIGIPVTASEFAPGDDSSPTRENLTIGEAPAEIEGI